MRIKQHIQDLENLPEPRKTFMEIMKVHKSEVHFANLLAYFFRSEESHALGNVFIKALLMTNCYSLDLNNKNSQTLLSNTKRKLIKNTNGDFSLQLNNSDSTIEKYIDNSNPISVKVEDPTLKSNQKNKRIDLLLTSDKCVICIEFKLNHDLNNPLATYQEHIIKMEEEFQAKHNKQRDLFFIVLTPYKKLPSTEVQRFIEKYDGKANAFSQVILSHFFKNIIEAIPAKYFIEATKNQNVDYLIDLIQTTANRSIYHKRNEILNWFYLHIVKSYSNITYHVSKGFIELKLSDFNIKLRFLDNRHIQIEKWSTGNHLELKLNPIKLSNPNVLEFTLATVNKLINDSQLK